MTKSPAVLPLGYRCMDQNFSFVWPQGRWPYMVCETTHKVICLRVHGNIPYLVPGDDYCQPRDPCPDYPLLSPCQRRGADALRQDDGPCGMPGPERADVESEPRVLDSDAQMQIVPPPKPHKEALLRKAAKELPHLLIHKPANPY